MILPPVVGCKHILETNLTIQGTKDEFDEINERGQ